MSRPSFSRLGNWGWGVRARRDNREYSWWYLILTTWSVQRLPLWRWWREGKWGRAVKDRQQSSFSCVFQFTSKTSLLHFCSAFVFFSFTRKFSEAPSHLGSPSGGLRTWGPSPSSPPHPGWVWKSLYWDKRCDGLFALPFLVAHLARRQLNQSNTATSGSQTSDLLYIFWLGFEGCVILCTFLLPSWAC